jgi:hypothetical protein
MNRKRQEAKNKNKNFPIFINRAQRVTEKSMDEIREY